MSDSFWSSGPRLGVSGTLALDGLQIRPSHYWPKVEDGMRIKRLPAHPFIAWLARWLPIDPFVEIEVPQFRDADPVLDWRHGIIFCSVAQSMVLRQELQRRISHP